MNGARCARTDLLTDQCACPDHRGEPAPWRAPDGIPARLPGVCPVCREEIQPGQLITLRSWDGRFDRWTHLECG